MKIQNSLSATFTSLLALPLQAPLVAIFFIAGYTTIVHQLLLDPKESNFAMQLAIHLYPTLAKFGIANEYLIPTVLSLLAITLALALFLTFKYLPQYSSADDSTASSTCASWKYIAAPLALFCVFLIYTTRYYQVFPLLLLGESRRTPNVAEYINQVSFSHILTEYNLGLGPLFYLLEPWIGSSVTAVKLFTLIFAGAVLITVSWLFIQSQRRHIWLILALTPALASVLTLVSLRRYKWHIITLLANLAVYCFCYGYHRLIAQDQHKKTTFAWLIFGICLFLLSYFLYRQTVIYIPILLLYLSIDYFLRQKNKNSSRILMSAFALSFLFVCAVYGYAQINPSSLNFLPYVKSILTANWPISTLIIWLSYFDFYFARQSLALSVLMVLGIVYSIRHFKTNWFARLTLYLFVVLNILLGYKFGVFDLDQNNHIVIPRTCMIMLGIFLLYEWIKNIPLIKDFPRLTAISLCLIMGLIANAESRYYFTASLDWKLDVRYGEPDWLVALMVLDANSKFAEDDQMAFLIPSGSNATAATGGFGELGAYTQSNFSKDIVNGRIPTYVSLKTLSESIEPLMKSTQFKSIIVYYNPDTPKPTIQSLLKHKWPNSFTVENISVPIPAVYKDPLPLTYLYFYKGAPRASFRDPFQQAKMRALPPSAKPIDVFDTLIHSKTYSYGNY